MRRVSDLAAAAVGRTGDLFSRDLAAAQESIKQSVSDRTILVVGGAGTIGAATIERMIPFNPKRIDVVDPSENGLAELVRRLRSGPLGTDSPTELRFEPLDGLGSIAQRFISDAAPYDVVMNFSALKHVRSEKDWYSQLRMLQVNVLLPYKLLTFAEEAGAKSFFSVSTDKAASPGSFLGATKRAMELAMLDLRWGIPTVNTARFANVALSSGSILESVVRRVESGQPISMPHEVHRFLLTPAESGSLCTLAAFVGPERGLAVPREGLLTPLNLLDAAIHILRAMGLEAVFVSSLAEGFQVIESYPTSWPIVTTKLDTPGEKEVEIFLDGSEVAIPFGLAEVQFHLPRSTSQGPIVEFMELLQAEAGAQATSPEGTQQLDARLTDLLGNYSHISGETKLDDRA